MNSQIIYKNFFIFSEKSNTSFFTTFSSDINIIHGKNTSGKSTIIQAIHYAFGINDEKHKLTEILSENVIFRLDFLIKKEFTENITIVRDDDFIYIKKGSQPLEKFSGISGNSSKEHIKLKHYLAELCGFNLQLETSGEYKLASLEAMFLPYYVAQDYGWVLALKSFRGLDFFRNFKYDYYDYYLGITNEYDRLEKQKLEKEKKDFENQIKFLTNIEKQNDELNLSKLKDESFISKSIEYIDSYKENKDKLIQTEKKYIIKCNELTFYEERLKILNKVKISLKKENPIKDDCPTCKQSLPSSLENIYEYSQDVNNTNAEIEKIKAKFKDLQSTINSLEEKISIQKDKVSKDYSILNKYKIEDLTFGTWLDNKTKVKLSENVLTQIGETSINLNKKTSELKKFKTDDEIKKERNSRDFQFKNYFTDFLDELNVKKFDDDKYTLLYWMGIFPKQGVELLKTMLAYYFAFNRVIEDTEYIHRLPFLLDAIFKEDIDEDNRKLILKFIYKNKPKNQQIIFSFAESKKNPKTAEEYNKELMKNEAKLILTDLNNERSVLKPLTIDQNEYLEETLKLVE
ncbi:ATP-binding protein [Flavobacterium psychrophilum]|uniref:ATP-binding protein n=1 Tax=Flavobacterium psychrophilum TaxID=96345 RepID=UPI00090980A0|nr:ATP-binding protein [Flavobacterium psychrophilum]EKT2071809.1 ATP-binding protein [Flavobacterium psychrophilum]EKT4491330.1 ATP-binding protein [Flavobacterium psychrophilum]SHH97484.1 Protein of unknown function [Flavobacterium psychrophilum]